MFLRYVIWGTGQLASVTTILTEEALSSLCEPILYGLLGIFSVSEWTYSGGISLKFIPMST